MILNLSGQAVALLPAALLPPGISAQAFPNPPRAQGELARAQSQPGMPESAEAQAAAAHSRSVGHGPEADTERPYARTWTAESSILASDDPPSCAGAVRERRRSESTPFRQQQRRHVGGRQGSEAAQSSVKERSEWPRCESRLGRRVATSQHIWSIHASADLRAQTLLSQRIYMHPRQPRSVTFIRMAAGTH